jgi:Kef-type K+ transport system membrane component KefB
MFSLSIWHLTALVILVLIVWAFVAVFGRIVNRAGYSRWWLLTMVVPVLNLITLWVFAFASWPVTRSRGQA